MIPEIIKDIAKKHNVTVRRDVYNCGKDYASSAGKEIMLGSFEDPDIELVAFFHELGHALSGTVLKRGCVMSTLSGEGLAWELGLGVAYDNGYEWDYYSDTLKWARRQLRSYVDGEYDDTKEEQ